MATTLTFACTDNTSATPDTGTGVSTAAGGGRSGASSLTAGSGAANAAGTGTAGSGGAGSGGNAGDVDVRGPTPSANGTSFPFPQNRPLSGCTFATNYRNADVKTAYEQWKAATVVSDGQGLRVKRLPTDTQSDYTPMGSTVSEGIAYGMILAVYLGDKATFDGLWSYEQQHLDQNGLMNWAISADGGTTGTGAATDADEDMAFALLLADKQWGGYHDQALKQIQAVWNHEIWESKLPRNGDGWGDWNNLNISYFAPAYYRLFKTVDTDPSHKWDDVIATVYDVLQASLTTQAGNAQNGLVPAWCTSTGDSVQPGPGQDGQPYHYQYDSCRTPFRIGLDYCWFGESRARDYVALTSRFFSGVGADNIVDGYELNGDKRVQFSPSGGTPTISQQSASFVGPAAVGAMSDAQYQPFLDTAYDRLATGQMLVGGAYYDQSWGVMSLLMLTGNFLNYTAIQAVP